MKNIEPKFIIIHAMSEYIKTDDGRVLRADEFLREIGLSVHALITPDAEMITQITPPHKAYHAGESEAFDATTGKVKTGLNNWSLGVELLVRGENTYKEFMDKMRDDKFEYTAGQYEVLARLVNGWRQKFGIPLENILTHAQVSGDHVRGEGKGKVDPGKGWNPELFLLYLLND